MKCNKCGCLVDEYYHSYKYNGLDYCCHCMLSVLVDELCDLVKHFDGEPVSVDNL